VTSSVGVGVGVSVGTGVYVGMGVCVGWDVKLKISVFVGQSVATSGLVLKNMILFALSGTSITTPDCTWASVRFSALFDVPNRSASVPTDTVS
jgi:hypothetical protein